jgi:hypothetical protein
MNDEEFKKNLDLIIAELEKIEWKAKKKLEKKQALNECLQKYEPYKAKSYEAGNQYQR